MISAKMATPEVFWKKGYEVIIPVCDVTNTSLSCGSNYIINAVMWPKFGNSSISMRQVIITSILKGFHQNNQFFWGLALVQVQ